MIIEKTVDGMMIGQLCRYKEGKKKRDMVHNALHSHAFSYNELHYFVPYY